MALVLMKYNHCELKMIENSRKLDL